MRILQLIVLCSVMLPLPGAWADPVTEPPRAAQEAEALENKFERTRELLQENASASAVTKSEHAPVSIAGTGMRMMQGLLLCLGVLALGVYVAKRLGVKSVTAASRKIQLKERLAVTPRTSLILAEVEGKSVLLSVGPDRVSFFEVRDSLLYGGAMAASDTKNSGGAVA